MDTLILMQHNIPEWAVQVVIFAIIFGGWIVRAIAKAYNNHLEKKQEQRRKQQQFQDRLRSGQATKGPDVQTGARQPVQGGQRGTAPSVPQRPVRALPPRRPASRQPQARPVPPPHPIQRPQPPARPTPPKPPVPLHRPTQRTQETPHVEHVSHAPMPSEQPPATTPSKPVDTMVQVDLPASRRPVVLSAEQAEKIRGRFDEQTRQLKTLQRQVSKQRSTIDQLSNDLQSVSETRIPDMSPAPTSLHGQFNPRSLRRVILLNEIIGQPVSLRDPLQDVGR